MRQEFFRQLYELMKEDERIYFITGDLGYGLADEIKKDFPDRFINSGAAEVTMMGMGVGLAMAGKIPIVYSITPFLIYRPYEVIRNYLNHERIPVVLVGSGRDNDYEHDGFSHYAGDDIQALYQFENIEIFKPEKEFFLKEIIGKAPSYLNLKR